MTATAVGVGRPAPIVVRSDAADKVAWLAGGGALTWLLGRILNAPDKARDQKEQTDARIAALEARIVVLETTVTAPTRGVVDVIDKLNTTVQQLAMTVERLDARMEAHG